MKTLTNLILTAAMIIILTSGLKAQFNQQWEVRLHAAGGNYATTGFVTDANGNYFVNASGKLSKVSSAGTVLWTVTPPHGINAMNIDQAGNVYIVSPKYVSYTTQDIFIAKYSSSGTELWTATDSPGFVCYPGHIALDNSGNIYVVGPYTITGQYHTSSSHFIKFNNSGVKQWQQLFSYSNTLKLEVEPSGNILLAGFSYYYYGNYYSSTLKRFSPSGSTLNSWHPDSGLISNFCRDNSGNIYVTGSKATMKINSAGTKVWETLNGFATSVINTDQNGNVYIAGSVNSNCVTSKLSASGQTMWVQYYDGTAGGSDYASQIEFAQNGDALVCGSTETTPGNSDFLLLRYSGSGSQLSVNKYNGPGDGDDEVKNMKVIQGNNVVLCGLSAGITDFDACLLKYADVTAINPVNSHVPEGFNLSQNYPNPFNPSTKISFSIPKSSFVKMVVYDITGKEVETMVNENLNAGSFEVDFNASKLTSGVYFYRIMAEGFTETKKMILTK